MNDKILELEAFEVTQPIGSFYVAKLDYSKLIKMASTDMKNILNKSKNNIYQRQFDSKRLPALKKYMEYANATFPNGILLNARENIIVSYQDHVLKIRETEDSFFIIDGQHRIEALKYYNKNKNFELCVVIFKNISPDLQTEVFATVNGEQKPVNPTVRLNLKGNDSVDTPEKLVRDIAVMLNNDKVSPFQNMIKVKDFDKGILSMAAFATPLLSYIYDKTDYYLIKDVLVMNENNRKILIDKTKYDPSVKILWNIYVDGADTILYKMIVNYFTVIKDIFSKTNYLIKDELEEGKKVIINQWNNKEYILSKTTGYNALMKLFKDIIIKKCDNDFTKENFKKILEPLNKDHTLLITQDNFGSGLAAAQRLYEYFYDIIFKDGNKTQFNSTDMDDFIPED